MSSLAFDTHKAIKDLEGAGANEKLAEVVVTTISTAINENVATKGDIADLKADIKAVRGKMDVHRVATRAEFKAVRVDIKTIRIELERMATSMATKADVEDAKKSMIIILGTMIVASIGAVAVFISALAGFL